MPRSKRPKKTDFKSASLTAAIYCRVSTREQGESGLSLEYQEDRCRKICEGREWHVFKSYVDVASGGSLKRPQFQQMLLDAQEKKFGIIIALRLDRISRVPKDFYNLAEELNVLDIGFTTVDNDFDTTTAQGRMVLGVMLQFASFERELGAERTMAAMRRRAEKGLAPAGPPILGYDKVDGELIVNKTEADTVKYIYEKYLIGVPPSKIAQGLNLSGKRTKKYTSSKGNTFGGKIFTRNHIYRIITNPLYAGIIYFRGDNLPGNHTPIISKVQFNQAQEIVKKNAEQKNLGNPKYNRLLLNGIIKCGFCGHYMTTRAGTGKNKKVYYYYQCTTAAHGGADSCISRQIKSDDIEQMTIELIRKTGSKKGYLDAIIENLTKSNQDAINKLNTEYVKLGNRKRKLEKDQQRLAKLAASDVNVLKMSGVVNELSDQQQHIDDIVNRQKDISGIVKQLKSMKVDAGSIKALYQEFDQVWGNLEKTDKRNLLNLLISEIRVSIKKKAKTGKITVDLVNGLPVDSLTTWTVGSSTCSVVLRRRDLNPQPSG